MSEMTAHAHPTPGTVAALRAREPGGYTTPWAPSQHAGMSCVCRHPDAGECSRLRSPAPDYDLRSAFADRDERCGCGCHDRDIDDEEEC